MPISTTEDELLDQIVDEMTEDFNKHRQQVDIRTRLRTKLTLRLQLIYLEAAAARNTNGLYHALHNFLSRLQLDPEGHQAKIEKALDNVQPQLEQLGLTKENAYAAIGSGVSRVFRQMR